MSLKMKFRSTVMIAYISQHYMKVHGEKQFECEKCNNRYRLERELRYHQKICNLNF